MTACTSNTAVLNPVHPVLNSYLPENHKTSALVTEVCKNASCKKDIQNKLIN